MKSTNEDYMDLSFNEVEEPKQEKEESSNFDLGLPELEMPTLDIPVMDLGLPDFN